MPPLLSRTAGWPAAEASVDLPVRALDFSQLQVLSNTTYVAHNATGTDVAVQLQLPSFLTAADVTVSPPSCTVAASASSSASGVNYVCRLTLSGAAQPQPVNVSFHAASKGGQISRRQSCVES